MTELHYGDLRARATQWWALQRARIRLTQAAGAAKKAGWGAADDFLTTGLKAVAKSERAAARATAKALAVVYPVVAQLVEETVGLGPAVALFLGLVPPLFRLEQFPGFPCPSALWAYSGLSAERRTKCDRRARMIAIAYLATPAIIRSPDFHALYLARRAVTVDRGWTKAHAHRDATRYVAKRILRILWSCRLPVGAPVLLLQSKSDVTAAGAPESDSPPVEVLPPATALSAPEPDASPFFGLLPVPLVSAPESAARPLNGFSPSIELAAPEPVLSPHLLLRPIHDVTAPGLA